MKADPFYQRLSFNRYSPGELADYTETLTANRWGLPLLATWGVTKHLRIGVGAAVSFTSDAILRSKLSAHRTQVYVNDFRLDPAAHNTIAGAVGEIEIPYRIGSATLAPGLRSRDGPVSTLDVFGR